MKIGDGEKLKEKKIKVLFKKVKRITLRKGVTKKVSFQTWVMWDKR